mgnify:CR=1 FL=1
MLKVSSTSVLARPFSPVAYCRLFQAAKFSRPIQVSQVEVRGLDEDMTRNVRVSLSLVQAIAQLHGGRLALEDAAPGLRVVLDFPLDGKVVTPHEPLRIAGPARSNSIRYIVVIFYDTISKIAIRVEVTNL